MVGTFKKQPIGLIYVTRDLEFDAGHRVLGHESKCAHLHGHRYKIEITVCGPELDPLGRVVDFSVLKTIVGGWIDANWDHNMILNEEDPLLHTTSDEDGESHYAARALCGRNPYVMSNKRNTTAEWLAVELCDMVGPLLPKLMHISQVVVHETPNCRATYRLERP